MKIYAPGEWVCSWESCNIDRLAQDNTSSWNPLASYGLGLWPPGSASGQSEPTLTQGSVQYCLAEKPWHPCQIDISPPIIIVVIICNAIKIVCFISSLRLGGSMYPIMTNGDTIQSFLLQPDRSLQNRCLASRADVGLWKEVWFTSPLPIQWRGRRHLWAQGATVGCWLVAFIPYAPAIDSSKI